MNKVLISSAAFCLLISCGGETETATKVNADEQSSVVETTNPELNSVEIPVNNEVVEGETTTIQYMEEKFNFGTVFYPSDNQHTFKFKNTGNSPLVISEATASCGCTIPNKPEKPILPGEIGELDVIFRPKEGQVGETVTKKITVKANTIPAETYLEISAKVLASL